MKEPRPLAADEKKFVAVWNGSVDSTAAKLGITCREASVILRRVEVGDAIRNREIVENKSRQKLNIITRAELEEFWSKIVWGKLTTDNGTPVMVDVGTQLKASEHLAKSKAMFTEKREISGPDGGPINAVTLNVSPSDLSSRVQKKLAAANSAMAFLTD
jgi:hypothetical protein